MGTRGANVKKVPGGQTGHSDSSGPGLA